MHLHLDTAGGFDGMALAGALAHLGVDMRPVLAALSCRLLPVPPGPAGPGFRLSPPEGAPPDGRRWSAARLLEALESLPLPGNAGERAGKALRLLADARALARGLCPEDPLFDATEGSRALIAVAAACWGLELGRNVLGVSRVTAAPLPWCSGEADGPQGPRPLPSPEAALLLRGLPLDGDGGGVCGCSVERLPACGVALAHVLPDAFDRPGGLVRAVGTGYHAAGEGVWMRLWLLEEKGDAREEHPHGKDTRDVQRGGGREYVAQLETHIDHLTGEELGAALEILAALPETLDVLWLPGIGKKSRPSGLLRLLCAPPHREAVTVALLRHTHTLGVRHCLLERTVLPRRAGRCHAGSALEQGSVLLPAKHYRLEGREYARPEADAVREAAAARGVGSPALRMSRPDGTA